MWLSLLVSAGVSSYLVLGVLGLAGSSWSQDGKGVVLCNLTLHLPMLCFLCPVDPIYERTILCFGSAHLRLFGNQNCIHCVWGVFVRSKGVVG